MNIATRYYSRSGNTEKLANAIGKATDSTAQTTDKPIDGFVDILFLGGGIYAGNIDSHLRSFAEKLTKEQVAQVVVFSTAAGPKSALDKLKEILAPKGIAVSEQVFQCRGKFLFANRNRPNDQDLADAASFAKGLINNKS